MQIEFIVLFIKCLLERLGVFLDIKCIFLVSNKSMQNLRKISISTSTLITQLHSCITRLALSQQRNCFIYEKIYIKSKNILRGFVLCMQPCGDKVFTYVGNHKPTQSRLTPDTNGISVYQTLKNVQKQQKTNVTILILNSLFCYS